MTSDHASCSNRPTDVAVMAAKKTRDGWTEAMLAGAFEAAWAISDAVLLQRRGQSCADLPYHLRWV